jgi:hypothetical protein
VSVPIIQFLAHFKCCCSYWRQWSNDPLLAVSSMNLASSWTRVHLSLPLLQQRNLNGLHHAHISLAVVLQMDRRETCSLRYRPPTQCLLRGAPLHPHPRPLGHPLEPYQQALTPSLDIPSCSSYPPII